MKTAVITVVINDSDGIDYQEVVDAKTRDALDKKLMKKLPLIIKGFHETNDFLEEEDEEHFKDVAEDLLEDETCPYAPSCYVGSGFIQIKFF